MPAYITVGTNDMAVSAAFYDATLPLIGWTLLYDFGSWRCYGEAEDSPVKFWIGTPFNQAPATHGNGQMTGFLVKSTAEVDSFYAAAMAHGARDEGGPGPRPHYGPDWYSAYLRDPFGNKLSVVFNG